MAETTAKRQNRVIAVLFFGSSNIGKSVTGERLAKRLFWEYEDIDERLRTDYHIRPAVFIRNYSRPQRDEIRTKLVRERIEQARKEQKPVVIAVPPITYMHGMDEILKADDVFAADLIDREENIFDRLVFTDDDDRPLPDADAYKMKHRTCYMHEIREDQKFFHEIYEEVMPTLDMDGRSPEQVVDCFLTLFGEQIGVEDTGKQ